MGVLVERPMPSSVQPWRALLVEHGEALEGISFHEIEERPRQHWDPKDSVNHQH